MAFQIDIPAQDTVEELGADLGQQATPGGGADLVIHHLEFLPLPQQALHGEEEVLAIAAIDPTGAQYQGRGAGVEKPVFTIELGGTIDIEGAGFIILLVGALSLTGEDKIRGVMEDGHAALGEQAAQQAGGIPIDTLRQVLFSLGLVHRRVGGGVDDDIGPGLAEDPGNGLGVGQVQGPLPATIEGSARQISQGRQGALQLPADLTVGANQQNFRSLFHEGIQSGVQIRGRHKPAGARSGRRRAG